MSDNKKLIIDHCKVFRAQEKFISELNKDFDNIAKSGEVKRRALLCLYRSRRKIFISLYP